MTDSINNILLIGAGQLGSRHLQGLAHINIPVEITVVDPSESSLATARNRFAEIAANPRIEKITFQTSVNGTGDFFDLAIIATGADVRADLVTSLITNKEVRNLILEKVLFQKESDYERVGSLLARRQVNTVVNCPRRLYPFYRKLRNILLTDGQVSMQVVGSNWGLGCNAIHFLDLFAFFTGNSSLEIDEVALDTAILSSKRPGYVEFTGMLKGVNARGDRFAISSCLEPDRPLVISIQTGTRQINIHESTGNALITDTANGSKLEEPFTVLYQSQLTGMVARDIFTTGFCGLTPYNESVQLHIPLLKSLLTHLNRVSPGSYHYCPIT